MKHVGLNPARFAILVGLVVPTVLPAGCVSASLASSTGPRGDGMMWSTANRQMVHVGEDVQFSFVLVNPITGRLVNPQGRADYCVTMFGDERIEATPDLDGRFLFSIPFSDLAPGDRLKVTASAYRQRGGRDFMKIRGRWMRSDSPYEKADKKVAADSISFEAYESLIEFTLVRPASDLDPDTGVLRIVRRDGSSTVVYVDRPNRPGFGLIGPEPDGYYHVLYRCSGDELNQNGTTDVEFKIFDRSGQPHEVSLSIDTP